MPLPAPVTIAFFPCSLKLFSQSACQRLRSMRVTPARVRTAGAAALTPEPGASIVPRSATSPNYSVRRAGPHQGSSPSHAAPLRGGGDIPTPEANAHAIRALSLATSIGYGPQAAPRPVAGTTPGSASRWSSRSRKVRSTPSCTVTPTPSRSFPKWPVSLRSPASGKSTSSPCTSTGAGPVTGASCGRSRNGSLTATVYAVAMALERNPAAGEAAVEAGFEVMSHGYRWINYHGIDEAIEREHIDRAVEIITRVCGRRPVGWCTGRPSLNTRRLVVEAGRLSLRLRLPFGRPALLGDRERRRPPRHPPPVRQQRHQVRTHQRVRVRRPLRAVPERQF